MSPDRRGGRGPERRGGSGRGWAASGVPAVMGALAVVATGLLLVPLVALLLASPWGRLAELVTSPVVLRALRLSLVTSLAAVATATLLGAPLAWVLARWDFPGRDLLRAAAILPMVLPPVVGGLGLLLAFGRRGLIGAPLESLTGLTIPFTTPAVVLAEAFVAMPFLVFTLEAGLRSLDRRYEAAAATLGADRWTVLRRVTLPLVRPALGAGMALCWARALGEFGATITFAGNLAGVTQTMPLAVYLELQTDPRAAYLIAVVLLGVAVAVLVGLRRHLLAGT